MRKLLQFFGVLDLIAFVGILSDVYFNMSDSPFYWLTIAIVILGLSLIVSGYFLIKTKLWGVYLNYLQFIPRLTVYTGMSFGFVYLLSRLFNLHLTLNNSIFIALVVIEVIRLGITIFIHFRYLGNNKASLQHRV